MRIKKIYIKFDKIHLINKNEKKMIYCKIANITTLYDLFLYTANKSYITIVIDIKIVDYLINIITY